MSLPQFRESSTLSSCCLFIPASILAASFSFFQVHHYSLLPLKLSGLPVSYSQSQFLFLFKIIDFMKAKSFLNQCLPVCSQCSFQCNILEITFIEIISLPFFFFFCSRMTLTIRISGHEDNMMLPCTFTLS